MNFIVTDNAVKKIQNMIELEHNKDKIGLRIKVEGGGCSGFMYNYELISEYKDTDHIINKDNIILAIDPVSTPFLENSKLEFITELGASYFQITNPNASAKCGCGNSFAI